MKNKKNFKLFGLFILLFLVTIGCSGCALSNTKEALLKSDNATTKQSKLDEISVYGDNDERKICVCDCDYKGKIKTLDKENDYVSYIDSNGNENEIEFPCGILIISHGKKSSEKISHLDKIKVFTSKGEEIKSYKGEVKTFDKEKRYLSLIDSDGYEHEIVYPNGIVNVKHNK